MEDVITISNGIGRSPDNTAVRCADTLICTAFDYDFDLQDSNLQFRVGSVHDKSQYAQVVRYESLDL